MDNLIVAILMVLTTMVVNPFLSATETKKSVSVMTQPSSIPNQDDDQGEEQSDDEDAVTLDDDEDDDDQNQ
jgi:hypothetical protein